MLNAYPTHALRGVRKPPLIRGRVRASPFYETKTYRTIGHLDDAGVVPPDGLSDFQPREFRELIG